MYPTLADLRIDLRAARATLRKLIDERGAGYYTVFMWRQYIAQLEYRIKAKEHDND